MRKQNLWIILIFLIPLLACSLSIPGQGNEAAQPADQDAVTAGEQPTTAPAAEPAAGEKASSTEEAGAGDVVQDAATTSAPADEQTSAAKSTEFSGVTGLDQMSAYRLNFVMDFDGQSGGQPAQGRVEMALEETKNPPARHMAMGMEGTVVEQTGGMNAIDFYSLDGKVYMKNSAMGDTWVSFSGDQGQTFEQGFFAPDEQLEVPKTANCDAQPVTVNGVSATHCTFNENDVASDEATFESLQGEVWVAAEGSYIVKLTMKGEGYRPAEKSEGDVFDYGSVSFNYDLKDINGSFAITLPEAAKNATDMSAMMGEIPGSDTTGGDTAGGQPGQAPTGDIPVLEGAENVTSMAGFVTYTTSSSMADVVAFYRQELPAAGWKENPEQSFSDDSTAILTFDKDGQSCMVTVTTEDNTTNVIAAIQ